MGYLRFIWTIIYVVIMFAISLPFLAIDAIIGLFSMKARDKFTMWVVKWSFSALLFFTGTKIHISGQENLPKDHAVVYIGNHKSFFDVIVSYIIFPNITSFIAKKEFEKVPFLSWWMKMLHNLFLDRKDIKQGLKTTLKAIDYVKDGISVVIFPEGTRNTSEDIMLPFHAGSFKIAEKSGAPIIPMTMYNMSAIFEDHFPQVSSEHVLIDFGNPIIVKDLPEEDRKHVSEYVRNIMINKYQELAKKHEEFNRK